MLNRFWVVTLALVVSAAHLRSNPQIRFGSVEGKVVDARDMPIPGAKVYDAPMDAVRTGKDHFVVTDEGGRFLLRDVPAGKAMIIATKTEAGYPDARFAVYTSNEVLPVVEVQANQNASGVVVKLLVKGGVLRGRILRSDSKIPISRARVTLSRVDHPEWFIETDAESDRICCALQADALSGRCSRIQKLDVRAIAAL